MGGLQVGGHFATGCEGSCLPLKSTLVSPSVAILVQRVVVIVNEVVVVAVGDYLYIYRGWAHLLPCLGRLQARPVEPSSSQQQRNVRQSG